MATLKRYNNFKSLKNNAITKVKKASNANTQQLKEIENFLASLKKKKHKSK
jgi:hypothetical protein